MKKDYSKLFEGTAEYYEEFRPRYLQKVFDHLVEYFGLDGQGRCLDLGCGTGRLAIPLARYFEEVIGIDPDEEMLRVARQVAEKSGVKNVQWLPMKAEEISDSLGQFRLTTMGISLHWFDQELVLKKVYDLTEKGGGLAIVGSNSGVWKREDEESWQKKRREIIQKYLGENRRAGKGLYKKPTMRFAEALTQSLFGTAEVFKHQTTIKRNFETILGFLYSSSYVNKRLLGDKTETFEKELREEMLKIEPSGVFVEEWTITTYLVKK